MAKSYKQNIKPEPTKQLINNGRVKYNISSHRKLLENLALLEERILHKQKFLLEYKYNLNLYPKRKMQARLAECKKQLKAIEVLKKIETVPR